MHQHNYKAAFAYVSDYDSFGFSDGTEEIMNAVASSLTIEILGESGTSTSATVTVRITTVDLREVYKNSAASVIPQYYQAAVSGRTISEAEIGERLVKEVVSQASDNYAPTVTTECDLKLMTDNRGKWVIRLDTVSYNAITGYLAEANNLITTGTITSAVTSPTAPQPVVTQPYTSDSDVTPSDAEEESGE